MISFPVESTTVTHGIQLAVAPVFLLTAVAGMIGAVAGRLARIIDRARALEVKLPTGPTASADAGMREEVMAELLWLRKRGLLANWAIGLLTSCAFLIGLTIIMLFLGETTTAPIDRVAIFTFLGGVSCFMAALACFLAETLLATRLLRFGQRKA